MSYLVLHFDVEFIVGTVCADNGTSYPITKENDNLLWLYFFNNPHYNTISFGKDNKIHFNNSEVNYFGRFFEKIEKEQELFTLRGIDHPVIDLLKESGLLDIIRKAYQQKTLDTADNIPTLITFSSSINDISKQKTIEYLSLQAFKIESYTIPLAELVCYYGINQKALKLVNGNVAVFIEATNSSLHLMKLSLSENYFLVDGIMNSWRGKGLDPRKRALVRFVVNEVNKACGVLSSEEEKEDECERLEMQADEWLRKLDSLSAKNIPFIIRSVSFSKATNMKRDVLVRKDDLDSDTGQYTQDLKDIFEAFKSENIQGDIAAVFLIGNCFQSDRVKTCFEQFAGKDRLFYYSNDNIRDILSVYPKIDIKRYATEEARIKERAKAEEQKQAEQRALEDAQRKLAEAEEKKQVEAIKAEKNRKDALKLFEKAIELEKHGKFDDARVNVENALLLDNQNREYKQFASDISDKINKLNTKNELYKKYLIKADKLLEIGDLEKAIEEYEAAKEVFENAEIIQKIIEVKRLLKEKEKLKLRIVKLISDANVLFHQKDYQNAKNKINEALSIENGNVEANKLLTEIDQALQQQEKQFNEIVKTADKLYIAANYEEAINLFRQALLIKSDNTYCYQQIEKITASFNKQKENREKCEKIIVQADESFQDGKWIEAHAAYTMALNLCPQDKALHNKLNQCNAKILAQEEVFKGLIADAIFAKKEGKLKEALSFYETALKMHPDDKDLKNRIEKLNFDLQFNSGGTLKTTPKEINPVKKIEGIFLGETETTEEPKSVNNDDFLHKKSNITTPISKEVKDFIVKKPKRTINDVDDFLGKKK